MNDPHFSQRWVHPVNLRYYKIILSHDLLGDWIVTKVWGGLDNLSGRISHHPCASLDHARALAAKLVNQRKSRGYELTPH